jgi:putative colanic acid biosynthesis acetyltransferase WcaF
MGKTDLSKFENSWYSPGGSGLKRGLWYLTNELVFKTGFFPFNSLKVALLQAFGATIGEGVVIKPCVNIKYPWRLSVEAQSWIGENVWIDNLDNVSIGPHCCLSQGAMLLCGSHNYKSLTFDLITKPITLEEGAWVGAQALVCPGVTMGSHAVLAAGSVATSDLPPYSISQGNPATVKRERGL